MEKSSRNVSADVLRGFAILMVVMGHTITGLTNDYAGNVLFNLIWCLQMPLFMLISGYVTRYSREMATVRDLVKVLFHKTIMYMQPWLVWTIGIRGLLMGESMFLNLEYLVWHMDSGYWFLFSIWIIVCCFALSRYIGRKLQKAAKGGTEWFYVGVPYVISMAGFALLGKIFGLSFLCMKQTLYYMPFFFLGYMYGAEQRRLSAWKRGCWLQQWATALCACVFAVLIVRFDFLGIEDNVGGVALRASASVTGCIAFCSLVTSAEPKGRLCNMAWRGIAYVGKRSMQLYVMHYLFLCMVHTSRVHAMTSPEGFTLTICNWAGTTAVSLLLIGIMERNEPIQKVLFAKW